VTTVEPRRADLLPRTLASLAAGGFGQPRIFLDGSQNKDAYEDFGLPVTFRGGDPVRTAGNWVLCLYELYARNPWADLYAVFQDDFICVRNLKAYLERCKYPDGVVNTECEKGYWNLYTFLGNEDVVRDQPLGWHQASVVSKKDPNRFQTGKGAVALVFNKAAVVDLLSSRTLVQRFADKDKGWKTIDGAVVNVLNHEGWREYVHNPSLVQHVGVHSTIDKRNVGKVFRWAKGTDAHTFPGESFNALDLLDPPEPKPEPVPEPETAASPDATQES